MANYFNNKERLPDIFEIARAYEDGNEGKIGTMYDGYSRTYNTLSNDEKNYL